MRPIFVSLALLLIAAPTNAAANCSCRAPGVTATHGQTLCIRTPEGARLARCEKVSNVSSWRFLNGPCPIAAVPPAIPSAAMPVARYTR
jgi:hypothetical protein